MKIKNVKVAFLEESILRSGYPMRTGEPIDLPINLIADEQSQARAKKLSKVKTGTGHDNFLKGIIVQFDLQYPQYFTPQLQRYNWIDIVSSQSKMHKLTSCKNVQDNCNAYVLESITDIINELIETYNNTGLTGDDKKDMFQIIMSNLPMGYMLWMGISTNYLQLKTIYHQRKNHKLEEWRYFCNWIESLEMSHLITGKNG